MPSYYDIYAKDYDKSRFSTRKGRFQQELEFALLSELLGDVRNKKVLEIGCGTGRISSFLSSMGARVKAVDSSKEMLEIACQKYPHIDFSYLDIEKAVPNGTYDIIIMMRVFFHLKHPKKAVEHLINALNKRGILIMDFLNKHSLQPLIMMPYLFRREENPTYFHSLSEVKQLIRPLEITEYRGFVFSPFIHLNSTVRFASMKAELLLSNTSLKHVAGRIIVKAQLL